MGADRHVRQGARDELACRRLDKFARQAWRVIRPGVKMQWNWHHRVLCEVLEDVYRGRPVRHAPELGVQRTVAICIPPRHAKTILTSIMAPAWDWLWHPSRETLSIASDEALAGDASRDLRDLVTSDWYRRLVRRQAELGRAPDWTVSRDQATKRDFATTAGGRRRVRGIGGRVTGKGGDVIIIDDPIDASQARIGSVDQVARRMAEVWTYYTGVLASRLNDPTTGLRISIAQRLHEDDLQGRLIREEGAYPVVLPTEYDPDLPALFGGAYPADPRTEPGDLLHPDRFPESVLAPMRRYARVYASEHLQRPTPAEGGLFRREWLSGRFSAPPRAIRQALISVDATFRGGRGSDYVVMQLWAEGSDGHLYLLTQRRGQWSYVETRQHLRALYREHAHLQPLVIIEEAANGPALIDDLRGEIPTLVGVRVRDSKESRAHLAALTAERGDLYLPAEAPWVPAYVEELCAFPGGAHDDQVDATTLAINRLRGPHSGPVAWSVD